MTVPTKAIHSLHSVPTSVSTKLPSGFPLHGLLAADLALKFRSNSPFWTTALPTRADFAATMPLLWPEGLHSLFPIPAQDLLKKQQVKFQSEWDKVAGAFPELSQLEYMYCWLIINTRTFYYTAPKMESFCWEDKLALLPAADLFNHSDDGCQVSFSEDGYSITANRPYRVGEELCISYGKHSNDFLLIEYGFVMSNNQWDEVALDEVIMPRLADDQKESLAKQGFLGEYKFHAKTGPCTRTCAAMAKIKERSYEGVICDGDVSGRRSGAVLGELLHELSISARDMLSRLSESQIGDKLHRDLLIRRWTQIEHITKATDRKSVV